MAKRRFNNRWPVNGRTLACWFKVFLYLKPGTPWWEWFQGLITTAIETVSDYMQRLADWLSG